MNAIMMKNTGPSSWIKFAESYPASAYLEYSSPLAYFFVLNGVVSLKSNMYSIAGSVSMKSPETNSRIAIITMSALGAMSMLYRAVKTTI